MGYYYLPGEGMQHDGEPELDPSDFDEDEDDEVCSSCGEPTDDCECGIGDCPPGSRPQFDCPCGRCSTSHVWRGIK